MPSRLTPRLILSLLVPFVAVSLLLLSQHSPVSVVKPAQRPPSHSDESPTTTPSVQPIAMSSSIRRAAPLVFPASGRHTATVIFSHGLGDSGAGWADAVAHWQRRGRLSEVKFILPNAPAIPITMNQGFQMPGWFDIKSLSKAEDDDGPGILLSAAYFHSLVQEEIAAGIAADRIILGGFSQGGAMSIFAGLTSPVKIGGIVGLSSWLLLSQKFKEQVPAANLNKETKIFMGHGDRDPMVQYPLATASQKKLQELGYHVTLKTYPGMEHSACLDELNDVEAFIASSLSK